MSKNDKKKSDETQVAPVLEDPTTVVYGEKVFAQKEKTIHIEVEPLPEEEKPPGQVARKTPVQPAGKSPSKAAAPGSMALEPPMGETRSHSAHRHTVRAAAEIPPATRPGFLSPGLLVLLALAAGLYFYQRSGEIKPKAHGAAGKAAVEAASVPTTDNATAPVIVLNKPVPNERIDDNQAVFVLKSDSDDFMVLVNGKDMPVISGKINLPLNRPLDIRFVRRGYKEIKLNTEVKSTETQEISLKFIKDPNAPVPRRLYN